MHASSAIPSGCLWSGIVWRVQLCLQISKKNALASPVCARTSQIISVSGMTETLFNTTILSLTRHTARPARTCTPPNADCEKYQGEQEPALNHDV